LAPRRIFYLKTVFWCSKKNGFVEPTAKRSDASEIDWLVDSAADPIACLCGGKVEHEQGDFLLSVLESRSMGV